MAISLVIFSGSTSKSLIQKNHTSFFRSIFLRRFNLETVVEGYVVKTKTVTIKPAKKNAPEERGVILLNK